MLRLACAAALSALSLAPIARSQSAVGTQPFPSFPIAVDQGLQSFPHVSGRYVAWSIGGQKPDNDVLGYDLFLKQPLSIAVGSQDEDTVDVSGNVVLWTQYTAGQPETENIFGRQIGGSGSFAVTTANGSQSSQAMSGNLVVWTDSRDGHFTIYGRYLDQPQGSDFPVSGTANFDQVFPDVSGNTAVWMSWIDAPGQGEIFGRNLTSGSVFTVSANPAQQLFPRISGNYVVWEDWRNGRPQIFAKNLLGGDEFPVSPGGNFDEAFPAIDGDLVVWMDSRNGTWDIYGRHLDGGPEFPITNTTDTNETWPDVSENTVVWEDSISGTRSDIYGAFLPEPNALQIVVLAFLMYRLGSGRRGVRVGGR